jgi:hypothetical protein
MPGSVTLFKSDGQKLPARINSVKTRQAAPALGFGPRPPFQGRWKQRLPSLELHKPIGAGIVNTSENGRDVDQLTLLDEQDQDERHKVESWRLHVLIDAGYPLPLAERLAQSGADLHVAVDLVGRQGCAPEIAADILL